MKKYVWINRKKIINGLLASRKNDCYGGTCIFRLVFVVRNSKLKFEVFCKDFGFGKIDLTWSEEGRKTLPI